MNWLQNISEIDTQWLLFLNGFHNNFWDTIFLMVTRMETWAPFFVVILYFFVREFRIKSILIILFLALTVFASDQLSVLIKDTVQRLRPVHEPAIQHLVHNVLRKGGLYGFVSSHATNSFALWIFTSHIFKNRSFNILMFFWALIFSYSRIYSGVHYPMDILGGAILGSAIGFGLYKAMMFLEDHFFIARQPMIRKTQLTSSHSGMIYLVFIVVSITVLIMAGLLHRYSYL